jgi:cell fate regulator YaaT (PSP1 superfamily)
MSVFDWLANMHQPAGLNVFDIIEVRFKNGRKDYYRNDSADSFQSGEIVAVEGSPGHDIGVVSLSGELVRLQLKKKGIQYSSYEFKKVFRKAKQQDIDKWHAARELEQPTMYKARIIAGQLGLQMKISDVEYQGDKSKAIFYYTADERVDFRELIKLLAEEFKVRIEMKQIGARQESARLGGIGSCGRELCCSTWLNDFRSVSTSAARYQQLSLNPMKLAGQCGKLKCCLNYELDSYLDALKDFPSNHEKLSVQNGTAYLIKTDIFRRKLFYQLPGDGGKIIPLSPERVKEIQESLKTGLLMNPDALKELVEEEEVVVKDPDFENVVGQDSLTRFDKKKRKKKSRKGNNRTENKLEVGTINTPIPNVQPAGARPNRPRPNPQAAQNTQNRPQRSGNPPEASQRRERPDQQKKTQHPRPQGNQERRPRPPRNPGGSEQKSPE